METYRIIEEVEYQKVLTLLESKKVDDALTILKRKARDLLETKESALLEVQTLRLDIITALKDVATPGIGKEQKTKLNQKIGKLQKRLTEAQHRLAALNSSSL